MAFFATLRKVVRSRNVWSAVFAGFLIVGQAAPSIAHYLPAGSRLSVLLGLAATVFTIYTRIRAKQPLGPVIDATIAQTIEAVHVIGASSAILEPATTPGVTTIANPLSHEGKALQLDEVKRIVKTIAAMPHS